MDFEITRVDCNLPDTPSYLELWLLLTKVQGHRLKTFCISPDGARDNGISQPLITIQGVRTELLYCPYYWL